MLSIAGALQIVKISIILHSTALAQPYRIKPLEHSCPGFSGRLLHHCTTAPAPLLLTAPLLLKRVPWQLSHWFIYTATTCIINQMSLCHSMYRIRHHHTEDSKLTSIIKVLMHVNWRLRIVESHIWKKGMFTLGWSGWLIFGDRWSCE